MTIPQALQIAVQHHQAGRLAEAEALYRQILAAQPNHAQALHFLGVIALQGGRPDLAAERIRGAIALDPNNPAAYSNLGVACRSLGRLDEAIAVYRRALELKPDYPEAHSNLGDVLRQRGQLDEAIAACRRALALQPDYPEAHLNLGNALAGQSRFEEAIAAYRRALALQPDYTEAHNNLGIALREGGQLEEAVASCRRALQVKPDSPEVYNNMGAALAGLGQFEEAIAAYGRALQIEPDLPEAHNNLGIALRERGRPEEAMAAFRRALALKPDYLEAHINLGAALKDRGLFEEALAACRLALGIKPDHPEAHVNLGAALAGLGQTDEAIAAYRHALALKPGCIEAHINLGAALKDRGQLEEAVAACRLALEIKPDHPEAHVNLGAALAGLGRIDEAVAVYRHALALKPGYPEAHNNLGNALRRQGKLDEGIAAYRRALALQPDYPEAHNNLGVALQSGGELDEAIAAYRDALQRKPDYVSALSNLVHTLHYHPGQNVRTISEEHERWNRRFGDPLKRFLRTHTNDRDPERRLRIGYVSPDFRDHAVGRYVLPLLERHDRERFEILCYAGNARSDWMTERLRALAGEWRNTVGWSDARMAEMIREDGVDILVDLAMHTAGNRLPVFARQPAPVQVSWLGYPGGTGLRGIGYRLTDSRMDPPGEDPARSAEEAIRLPDCWCCYDPVDESPEINALAALSDGGVAFGSLNNFAKVHGGVLACWARILEAVNGSRLVMLCPEGRTRERVRAFFGERGIVAERVELVGFAPRREYLRLYQRIDIALDPFPYNGMTTTCDALWMGAPVLTLAGAMPVSRAGLSLLSTVGLGEWVAYSKEDYVRMAVALAGDLPRLADLRATLRARMQASALMDAPRFARNVEAAYRKMWERWCAAGG